MATEYAAELARQLQTHFVGRNEMLAWLRAVHDDFHGDALDARWAGSVSGSGVAFALVATSPSRISGSTGATASSSVELHENGFLHWKLADRLTVVVRSILNDTTLVRHRPIYLRQDASNGIRIEYDTSVPDTGWRLRTTAAGVTTTSAVILAANTLWNTFVLTLQTGSVKARINNSAELESVTNLPAGDMQFKSEIFNHDAFARISELDYVTLIPGLALF